ncbi:MAG: hypothetical protein ACE5FU_01835 [Nitrospinota bacterium]
MTKFSRVCFGAAVLLTFLFACNTSSLSTMKTSAGPSSPNGYLFEAKISPDVQKAGLTSIISVHVWNTDGSSAGDVTVSFLGNVKPASDTTDASGNVTSLLTVEEGTNSVTVQIEDIGASLSVLGQP